MAQRIRIDKLRPELWIIAAFLLLTLPLRWLFAAVLAAAFHEICHIGTVFLLGGRIDGFSARWDGVKLEAQLTPGKQLLCTLAGPLGSLMLLAFGKTMPVVAICAGVQGLYNLLPIWPLDGGRALKLLLRMVLNPDLSGKIANFIEITAFLLLFVCGLYLTLWAKLGIMPLLLVSTLLLKKYSLQTAP